MISPILNNEAIEAQKGKHQVICSLSEDTQGQCDGPAGLTECLSRAPLWGCWDGGGCPPLCWVGQSGEVVRMGQRRL